MTGDVCMTLTLDPKDVAQIAAIVRIGTRDGRDAADTARAIADFIEGLDLRVTVNLPAEAPPPAPADTDNFRGGIPKRQGP